MSPRTPEAPPLSQVLDKHEQRGARGGEVVALVVGFIGGLVLGGATVALVPEVIAEDAAPESRLLVPIEKCIGRGVQGGGQP